MPDESPPDPIMGRAARHREERRAVEEAGGGESEGFELAEQDLIDHASHADDKVPTRILAEARWAEEKTDAVYGEADDERKPN